MHKAPGGTRAAAAAAAAAAPQTAPHDIRAVQEAPDYQSIAKALDSVMIPLSTSRHNVKRDAQQIVEGMCLGVVNARSMVRPTVPASASAPASASRSRAVPWPTLHQWPRYSHICTRRAAALSACCL
eukprot:COSAG06_NODE_17553_length_934_cov_1.693413_2_plen_126_part_01